MSRTSDGYFKKIVIECLVGTTTRTLGQQREPDGLMHVAGI
jgi:hypothetical protein